jgi:succinoglycan biosynthesis transport protein ExoP
VNTPIDSPEPSAASPAAVYLDYLKIIWQRKSLAGLGIVVALVGGALYYVQRQPIYESDAQVLVINKRPDAGMGGGVHLSHFEDYVSTHRVLVLSPLIVDRAIEEYKLGSLKTFEGEEDDLTEAVIEKLSAQRGTKESGTSQNSILNLSFRGPVRAECPVVVNAVLSSYKKFLDETYRNMSDDTVKLIADARDTLKKDLADKEAAYREFRRNSPLLWRGKDEVNPRQDRLTKIEAERSALLLSRAELESRLATVQNAIKQGSSHDQLVALISDMVSKSDAKEPGRDAPLTLQAQLLPLLLEEQTLMQDFGRNHPQVQSVRNRIDATRKYFALPSASYSKTNGSAKPGVDPPSGDLVELALAHLRQELDRVKHSEESLAALYESEHESARKLTTYELEDEQFRSSIARTHELCDGIIKRLQDMNLVKDYGGFEARIIAPATRGEKVVPKASYVLAGSLFLGLMGGCCLAFVAEVSDKSFRTPEEIRRRLGLPILGHIPLQLPDEQTFQLAAASGTSMDPMLCTFHQSKSPAAEAYRGVRTALYFSNQGENHKTIQITSPNMGDGKSTIASNLAVSIAQSGKTVVLIDADLRRPRQHKIFGVTSSVGLSSVIVGDAELADAVQETDLPGLSILPSGPVPMNPAELLTSPKFQQMLEVIRDKYDYVLVDSAPLLAVTDPSTVAPRVDGVLLAVSISKHGRTQAERAKEILNSLEAKVLGVVVNRVSSTGSGGYGFGAYQSYQDYKYSAAYHLAADDDPKGNWLVGTPVDR